MHPVCRILVVVANITLFANDSTQLSFGEVMLLGNYVEKPWLVSGNTDVEDSGLSTCLYPLAIFVKKHTQTQTSVVFIARLGLPL